jgi:hypothetical protein
VFCDGAAAKIAPAATYAEHPEGKPRAAGDLRRAQLRPPPLSPPAQVRRSLNLIRQIDLLGPAPSADHGSHPSSQRTDMFHRQAIHSVPGSDGVAP